MIRGFESWATYVIAGHILIRWNQSSLLVNFAGYVNCFRSCTNLSIRMPVGAYYILSVEDCGYWVCIDEGLMQSDTCIPNSNGIVCFIFRMMEASDMLIFRETLCDFILWDLWLRSFLKWCISTWCELTMNSSVMSTKTHCYWMSWDWFGQPVWNGLRETGLSNQWGNGLRDWFGQPV